MKPTIMDALKDEQEMDYHDESDGDGDLFPCAWKVILVIFWITFPMTIIAQIWKHFHR